MSRRAASGARGCGGRRALPVAAPDALVRSRHAARRSLRHREPAIVIVPGLACGPWAFAEVITHLAGRHALPALRAPVLFVVPYDPDEHARDHADRAQVADAYGHLLDGTSHLSVVTLSPARHFAMLDRAAKVARALDDFTAAASSTPAAEGAAASPKPQ